MNSRATNSGNPIKLRSVALFQREETQVLPCIDSTPANGHQDFSRFWSSLLSAVYVTFAAPMRRSRWGGFCLTFLSQKWQDWIVAPRLLLQCCKKKVARFRNFFYFGLSFVRKTPKSVKVHTALIEDDEEEVGTATFGIVKGGWVHTGRRWSLFWRSPKIHRRCTCSKQSFDAQRFTYLSDAKNKGKGTV